MIEENNNLVRLHELIDESVEKLSEAIQLINAIRSESKEDVITNITQAVGHIWNARRFVPEDPRGLHEEVPEPLPSLTDEQLELIGGLTVEQIREIDDALVLNTSHQWRKVARIVGSTMMQLNDSFGLPDVYYAQRIMTLVDSGRLEAQGNLEFIRFSEVRLPN